MCVLVSCVRACQCQWRGRVCVVGGSGCVTVLGRPVWAFGEEEVPPAVTEYY